MISRQGRLDPYKSYFCMKIYPTHLLNLLRVEKHRWIPCFSFNGCYTCIATRSWQGFALSYHCAGHTAYYLALHDLTPNVLPRQLLAPSRTIKNRLRSFKRERVQRNVVPLKEGWQALAEFWWSASRL